MSYVKGYKELCGLIQAVSIKLMDTETTHDGDNDFILMGAYYIGYIVGVREDYTDKKELGELLASYMKDYNLCDIEIFDMDVFCYFIFKWNELNNNMLSYKKVRQLIGENYIEYGFN